MAGSIQDVHNQLAWSQAIQLLTQLDRELQRLNSNLEKALPTLEELNRKIPEKQE
jgi:ABC-type uncharacterized transport system permease subunit